MSDYLKLFDEHTQYDSFIDGGVVDKPNVSHCLSEGHVHYNPCDYKITGKFTVPSRLLNVVEGESSSGGGDISPKKLIGGGGTTYASCYGLNNGINVVNNPTVTYSDNTEIFDSRINDISLDYSSLLEEGQEYVEIRFKGYLIDEDTDEIIYNDTYVNPSDGETYYNSSDYQLEKFRGILENGVFMPYYYDRDNNKFVTTPIPKIVHRIVNVFTYDGQTGMYTYEKINANCIYVKKDENDIYDESTNHQYNGTLTVTDNITTYVLLMNTPGSFTGGVGGTRGVPSAGMVIKSIKIDGEEIRLKDLEVGNNGWYALEEGVHDVEYLFDYQDCFENFGGGLSTQCLKYVPIESMTLDSRFEWIGNGVFNGCALLDTQERVIKRVCTTTIKTLIGAETITTEPIIMDCEFEDEDDYITYTKFTEADYYALHDGKVGMHVCEFEQGSEGGGSSTEK